MKRTILIVEDELHIRDIVYQHLIDEYNVFEAEDGVEALEIFEDENIDLLISDIMMPNMDGWTLVEKIRETSNVPIILLTALTEENNQIRGYDLKIDDYVCKPFSTQVLVKKVEAVLNRTHQASLTLDNQLEVGKIKIDIQSRKVFVDSVEIICMPKEYDLLLFFLENQNVALSRDDILDKVWGIDYFGDTRVVDTHVKKIRKKIAPYNDYIKTVFGIGYRFEVTTNENSK